MSIAIAQAADGPADGDGARRLKNRSWYLTIRAMQPRNSNNILIKNKGVSSKILHNSQL